MHYDLGGVPIYQVSDPGNISDGVVQTAGELVEMSSTFNFFVPEYA